ncbi:MAG: DUF1905 domain-containing protein [Terracidiphilus sp.]
MELSFRARLWASQGESGWHFLTLPGPVSREIRAIWKSREKPGGSVRVRAILGSTRWRTSIFYDTKRDAYLLPVKAAVRERERAGAGDEVEITLIVDDA